MWKMGNILLCKYIDFGNIIEINKSKQKINSENRPWFEVRNRYVKTSQIHLTILNESTIIWCVEYNNALKMKVKRSVMRVKVWKNSTNSDWTEWEILISMKHSHVQSDK